MVVDRGVGAAAVRAGQRERARAQALAADQQLRRGADEAAVAAPDGEDEARGEGFAQHAEHRRRGRRSAGACTSTSRASTIFSNSPGADPLGGAGDGALVVGRAASRSATWKRPDGCGVEQRQRPPRAARPAAARCAASSCVGSSSGATSAASVRRTSPAPPRDRDARVRAARRARNPPSGGRRRRPRRTRSRPRRPARPRRVPRAGRRSHRPRARASGPRRAAKRSSPRASSVAAAPRAASAAPPRSGCSRHIHGSPARREASATADGSTSAAGDAQPGEALARRRGAAGARAQPHAAAGIGVQTRAPAGVDARRTAELARESGRRVSAAGRPAAAGLRSRARPRGDRDLARAHHLDQPERADHALEGVDLVGRCR